MLLGTPHGVEIEEELVGEGNGDGVCSDTTSVIFGGEIAILFYLTKKQSRQNTRIGEGVRVGLKEGLWRVRRDNHHLTRVFISPLIFLLLLSWRFEERERERFLCFLTENETDGVGLVEE